MIDLVAGARPNFVKLAPVVRAIARSGRLRARVVHTGQHYDPEMNDVFFQDLQIPPADVHLEVGSGSHGAQTARILERYEAHLAASRPGACVVFGDVNSTAACSLAASKLGVPVAHVEAGLRSFDRSMPEEINRIVTDVLSDLLLVSEPAGLENLRREGVPESKVVFVGNVMIDSLRKCLQAGRERARARSFGLSPRGYGFVTLHRPSNVDDPARLRGLVELLVELSQRLPLVFSVHPRTRKAAEAAGLQAHLNGAGGGGLRCMGPLPYLDTLSLVADAAVVLTDSGGLQEETSVLHVPCLTLRENTERPVTTTLGTSRLVGNDAERIRPAFGEAVEGRWPVGAEIPLWDGQASERVTQALERWLGA